MCDETLLRSLCSPMCTLHSTLSTGLCAGLLPKTLLTLHVASHLPRDAIHSILGSKFLDGSVQKWDIVYVCKNSTRQLTFATLLHCAKSNVFLQVCIITGANAGIGAATAAEMVARGAHVIMACRSLQRGKLAAEVGILLFMAHVNWLYLRRKRVRV